MCFGGGLADVETGHRADVDVVMDADENRRFLGDTLHVMMAASRLPTSNPHAIRPFFGAGNRVGSPRIDMKFFPSISTTLIIVAATAPLMAPMGTASLGGSITDSSGAVVPNATRFNLAANKGLAGFDIPQNFVASFVYAVPRKTNSHFLNGIVSDWNLSGIVNHYSGVPYSVFLSGDIANIGTVSGRSTQYPNLVGDPNAIANRTPQQWFNTAAFAQPAQYTFGNAGRDILRTDSLNGANISLYKRWPFLETRHIELHGEFFNLLNHPSLGYPSDVVGTAQFAKVSNTRNSGRQVQLAVKIHS